jgi:uracil-DNA glycosylase
MRDPNPSGATALASLRWLIEAGADEAIGDVPVNRFAAKAALAVKDIERRPVSAAAAAMPQSAPRPVETAAPAASRGVPSIEAAREIAERCQSLDALREALLAFEGCALKSTATNLVFADGHRDAPIMFVGEAPGRDEDLKGLPFVGQSGQLLDRMLAPLGFSRATNVYIANILFWRPPGNREPTIEEVAISMPFVERHIALKRPKILVALGTISAKQLLQRTDGITRLRGKWGSYATGGQSIPLIATFHPANLLRNPINKRYVWRDFLAVAERLEEIGGGSAARG